MKRLAASAIACLVLLALASPASAQISGSAHDFSDNLAGDDIWNTSGEMCAVCHTPHNGGGGAGAPLWDHEITTGGAGFTLYSSNTLTATMADPTGESLLCLSCHDGTVALDNFAGATGGATFVGSYGANRLVGIDLSNDHPVSFAYGASLPDGELAAEATVDALGLLFGGNVECASCHDVHNNGAGSTALLRIDNAGSAFCRTCHTK